MRLDALRSMALMRAIDEAGVNLAPSGSIVNEAAEDEEKKKADAKKKKDDEPEETPDPEEEESETPAEDEAEEEQSKEGEEEEPQDDGDAEEEPEGESDETPEGDEPPAEDGEETPGGEEPDGAGGEEGDGAEGGGESDFSLDADDPEGGEDEGPAPDGLPEADDDGSGDTGGEEEAEETNVHTNILQLSKLDRALAKKTVGENYTSLRSTIRATIGVIDRNAVALDPDVRQQAEEKLENLLTELETFIMYKFPLANYEDALTQYLVFAKSVNDTVDYVRNKGIVKKNS